MVTVYERVGEDRWGPQLPAHCPFGGDGRPCRVGVHGLRERQHGPGHPLAVAVCHAHGRYFTLYPPGWTPWGRIAVQAMAEDGSPAWPSTVFVAAVDAAAGRMWPETSVGALGCGRTQSRWLARCGRWLGLAGTVETGERAACELTLPLASALAARAAFVGSARRRSRGQAVEQVLNVRTWGAADLRSLLVVGGRSGVCGRAWMTGFDGGVEPVFSD